MPSYETLTRLVLEQFPNSRWKESHYAWYRSQINTGKINLTNFIGQGESSVEEEDLEEQVATEFSISIEKDLQIYLSNRLAEIEEGLTLISREYKTEAGFIDILCKDKNCEYVVIETKAGKAKEAALGQILGYMGALKESGVKENIRGIIVASDFESRVVYAVKALQNITLAKYNLCFTFERLH